MLFVVTLFQQSGHVAGARLRGEETCHRVVVASSSN